MYIIWQEAQKLLSDQPVISGAITLWLLAVGSYFARNIPNAIYGFAKRRTTVHCTLNSSHKSFHKLLTYLDQHVDIKKCRTTRVTNGTYGWQDKSNVSVGIGYNLFWFKKWPCLINRKILSADGGGTPKEEITISTVGINQDVLLDLISESLEYIPETKLQIHNYKDGWESLSDLSDRSLDSVVLPKQQKKRIITSISKFLEGKEKYKKLGINHKLGILLYGPPGTGKTSLVKALCSHFNKNICLINCQRLNDQQLQLAISKPYENSIVLLEDFDAVSCIRKDYNSSKISVSGPTRSGMLNALDGIFDCEDRIIIATTNNLEDITKSVIRPGRFDITEQIDLLDKNLQKEMVEKFGIKDFILEKDKISAAKLECEILKMMSKGGTL